jgi:site-specific recombinase XerD
MTPPDLAVELRYFLCDHLPIQRNASPLTVLAYRDTFKLLVAFASKRTGRPPDKLALQDLTRPLVLDFLQHVEKERGNCVSTRNARLGAIRSFFGAVALRHPDHIEACRPVRSIPKKRGDSRVIDVLTIDEVNAVLAAVDTSNAEGRRDDTLLRFLHNTGARIQEALDATEADVRFETPSHVRLMGKGRKERVCPLWPETAARLRRALDDRRMPAGQPGRARLFLNRAGEPLTRFGARYILSKYVKLASTTAPTLKRKRIHPHTLRHTTALHLLQSGVDLNTVRCWLGHTSVVTTNRYVEIDLDMKRAALEAAAEPAATAVQTKPPDDTLLSWLESL